MSLHLQNQIRQNATNVREYFSELKNWTDDIENIPKKKPRQNAYDAPIRGTVENEEDLPENKDDTKLTDPKRIRDKNTVQDYYKAWDNFDPDKAEKEIEEEAKDMTKQFIDSRQDNKEGIQKKAKSKIIVKGGRSKQKTDVEAMKENANLFFKERKFNEAIDEYIKTLNAIEEDPDNMEFNMNLYITIQSNKAQAYINIGELQKAIKDCTKVQSLNPDHIKCQFRRATCYKKLKNWRAAKADIVKSQEIQKGDKEQGKELSQINAAMNKIKNDILAKMNTKFMKSAKGNLRRIMIKDTLDSKHVGRMEKKEMDKETEEPTSFEEEKAENDTIKTYKDSTNTTVETKPIANDLFKNTNNDIIKNNSGEMRYEDFFKQKINDVQEEKKRTNEFLRLKNVDGNFGRSLKECILRDKGIFDKTTEDDNDKARKIRFQIFQNEEDINKRYRPSHRQIAPTKTSLKFKEAFLTEKKTSVKVENIEFNDELVKKAIEKYFQKEMEDIENIKTSAQFLTMWKAIRNDEKTQKAFLLTYNPEKIENVFRSGMEFADFNSLFKALSMIKEDPKCVKYLEGISRVSRMKMTVKMMTKKEKEGLREFFKDALKIGHFADEESMQQLLSKYLS